MSVGQKCIPVPDWQEIICGHFISPARCFEQGYRSPSLLTVSFLVKFSVWIDGIFLPSVRQYKKGAAIFAGTFCAYYYYFALFFFCSPSFSQHQNNYFSFPWSFSLILGIHLHLSVFACLQSSFIPLPYSSSCFMGFNLSSRSWPVLLPNLQALPTLPRTILMQGGGGRWKGGTISPYSLSGHPPLSFFLCVSTPWNLPPPSCCDLSFSFLPLLMSACRLWQWSVRA